MTIPSIAAELMESRKTKLAAAEEIAQRGVKFGRDLTATEQSRFDELLADAKQLQERAAEIEAGEARSTELEDSFRERTGHEFNKGGAAGAAGPRYAIPAESLRSHFDAIVGGGTASTREAEVRAMVTTTQMGVATTWASNAPGPAQSLREFAGLSVKALDGLTAVHPSVTLPTGSATGAAENATHTEVGGIAPSTLTASRYGAWSNASAAVRTFDDLAALSSAHAIHIARSLTLADIATIDTQAGTATVYTAATFEQTIRSTVLTVAAAAGVAPTDLVVFGRPDALAIATGYSPTNGADRGSVVERLYGARIFPAVGAAAAKLTFFAPSAFVAFESVMGAATTIDPKDGSTTFGSWLHATAAGPAIVGCAKALATA